MMDNKCGLQNSSSTHHTREINVTRRILCSRYRTRAYHFDRNHNQYRVSLVYGLLYTPTEVIFNNPTPGYRCGGHSMIIQCVE